MQNPLTMSAIGTKRTCASAPLMSAFGGKADIAVSANSHISAGRCLIVDCPALAQGTSLVSQMNLACTELRRYGADSIQVVWRLRAMIETLIRTLPEDRHAALQAQLVLCSITPSRLYTVFRRNWLSLGQRIHSSSAGHRFEKSSQRLQAVFRFCIVISRMSAIGTKRTSLVVPHLSAFGG